MLHRRSQVAVLGSVLVLGVLLAGCGSKSASSAAASSTTTAVANRAAFNTCLQQHGVDPSTVPGFGGGGRRSGASTTTGGNGATTTPTTRPATTRPTLAPDVQAAVNACRDLLPQRPGGFGGANSAYVQCLQQHGVTFTPGQGPPDSSDPTVQALQACASLRPARTTTTSTPSTTTA